MAIDVIDFREFYASPVGKMAAQAINAHIMERWDNVSGLAVSGLGYAIPYLDQLKAQAERAIALMPGSQGVIAWPPGDLSAVGLIDPYDLPLRDAVIDRLLVVHALEMSENALSFLEECWRVLTPGGRMIVIAPSRGGGWSRRDSTPFGHGLPYSRRQLTALLRQALFTPMNWQEALYFPPSSRALVIRIAPYCEQFGRLLTLPFAGVHIIEATKQLYRPALVRRSARANARLSPALILTSRNREA